MTREEMLIETLDKIAGISGCCMVQRLPSDDKIIPEHIEEMHDLAADAIKAARRAPIWEPGTGPDEQCAWYDTSEELR